MLNISLFSVFLQTGLVGITSHAATELGDIVHIEFPDVGTKFATG